MPMPLIDLFIEIDRIMFNVVQNVENSDLTTRYERRLFALGQLERWKMRLKEIEVVESGGDREAQVDLPI